MMDAYSADARLQPGHRHRQAARPRRRARPGGGHRPRRASTCSRPSASDHGRRPRSACASRSRASATSGSWVAARAARARAPRSSACPTCTAALVDADGLDVPSLVAARRRRAARSATAGGGDADHQRGAARARLRRAGPGRPRRGDHRGQRRPRSGPSVVLEAANYPVTPDADKILARPRRHGDPRHPRQRRRRHRLVLRVDPEHPAVHVEGGALQRGAPRPDAAAPTASPRPSPTSTTCTLRQAAFAIGIQRVADAAKLRGYI